MQAGDIVIVHLKSGDTRGKLVDKKCSQPVSALSKTGHKTNGLVSVHGIKLCAAISPLPSNP